MPRPKDVHAVAWTIGLLTASVIISFILGVLLGSLVGWSAKSKKTENIVFAVSLFLSRLQYYAIAMILVYLLTYLIPVFPTGGAYTKGVPFYTLSYVLDILWHAFLPALSLILVSVGAWALASRGLVVSLRGEDYMLLARAKGLRERRIFTRYALKNALLPQVADLGLSLGSIACGSVITEMVFQYPGMGFLMYRAVTSLDYTLIQGISLMYIFGIMTAALIVDIILPLIDPRVRYE